MSTNLELTWSGGMKGSGNIKGEDFNADIAIPSALGGQGSGSNPKELYVASTASCFLATLAAISEGKKLPVESLSVQTNAVESKEEFTITHQAYVTLTSGAPEAEYERAKEIVASADKICAVGNLARKAGVNVSVVANVK